MIKAVVHESKLGNIIEEFKSIGFKQGLGTQSMVYFKDTFYTLFIKPEEKMYQVEESSLQDKIRIKHYDNETYDELFDKRKYILEGEGEELEIISFYNVYSYILGKEGFSEEDIRHIASYETLSKHSRVINRLKLNRSEGEYEPPKIEEDINVVANLIKENVSMFRKYIRINELNDVLAENDPEEPKNSSFSDIFKAPKSHKYKFEDLRYNPSDTRFNYNLSDARFNPGVRFYDSVPSAFRAEYSNDWIEEQLRSMESQDGGIKRFSVSSQNILISLMSYLSVKGYSWEFKNLNENAEERSYPISHAPVSTLYGNGFFMEHNGFDYSNKIFTLDPYNEVIKYWGVERPTDRENLETMVEVFPKLSA